MNIILLSGGSGKRLWPLSNDIRSKQFIKLFKKDNTYESMVQRIYHQIREADSRSNVVIATSRKQVSVLINQLGNDIDVCVEPCRRDTFPAIALAASYLHDFKKLSDEESVIVCPVDPYVSSQYFLSFKILDRLISEGKTNISLMGIQPTYPSEKYGYIIPEKSDAVSLVKSFREKPDLDMAKKYVSAGALWNSGVFAFKLSYILRKSHELIPFTDFDDLSRKYDTLEKISFDYAVVEKEKSIQVLRFNDTWKDIGTWNTLTEEMSDKIIGKGILGSSCINTNIINELNIPVLCMGLKDIVVAASNDGILVSNKEQSSFIKPYVDEIDQTVMYAEKSWGFYQVINIEDESLTIKVTLNPKCYMNYHSHEYRDEIWNVICGSGVAVVDGRRIPVRPGVVVNLPRGCRHTVIADAENPIELIEIQIGEEISVKDKIKYDFDYGKIKEIRK